jgi:predicted extracellular nuclease
MVNNKDKNMTDPVRGRFGFAFSKVFFVVLTLVALPVHAQVVASDMVNSSNQNLLSYTNPYTGAFTSAADGFQKYQRGVSATIPFSVLDDSLATFPGDTLGIIDDNNLDEFFGVTDTENGDNSGPVSATWVFDITGATDLALSIDMGAMGDFESSDTFTWEYSIDGGPTMTAFSGVTDEAASNEYTLAGGAVRTLNDPLTVQGEILTNVLRTFSTLLSGTGAQLTLTLTAETNGGSEAFAFQNIVINEGGLPLQALAYDMVESGNQRLNDFVNPFTGAFTSAADGFQKYQRGVSSTIPFAVLDDSLVTFPGDTLGIVDDNNLHEFFGVVDTENGDNAGPVTATWTFDISGGTGLGLAIDMGAMGDFESSDWFVWEYSIDGGPTTAAFSSSTDEAGSHTYVLASGTTRTLNDPMTLQGAVLTNVLTRFTTPLAGTGNELVLTLTAMTNGGSEAFAFQNIVIAEGFEGPEPPPVLEIFEIQGNGSSSPYDGEIVESRENVVTALAPNGFFMQTPDYRSDLDVDTSDGIFVFTGGAPAVVVGDVVDVLGTVDEFFGLTEFDDDSTVTVVSTGYPLPPAVVFDATTPSPDPASPSCAIEFECYENMLISITNGTVTGPNQRFGSDTTAEVHITAAGTRTFREPGVEFPGLGMPPIPTWDGNPEIFELDPNKLGLPNQQIPAGSHFDATGVLGFEFGGYELWPTVLTVDAAPLVVPVRARNRAEFTVGSLNVFRLFDDIDDPADVVSPDWIRDDSVRSTAEYDRRRAKLADYVVNVLDAPDILAIQEVEKLEVLEGLADEIAMLDGSLLYSAFLEEGNDRSTIDVGFLVRDTTVVDAVTQLGKDEILPFDDSLLNDRPPLLLEGRVTEGGSNFPVAVIVVHNRSLGGIDSSSSGERIRAKRLAQAVSLAEKIQAMQDANPDVQLVVTGDFNAFEFSDGYVDVLGVITGSIDPTQALLPGPDLVEPDLVNHSAAIDPMERYSFIFRGSAQILDHALTSMALDMSFRGLEYGRGNADAAVDLINTDGTPARSSDHDGLVLYITRDRDDDGVFDSLDVCPATSIPEAVPADDLGTNRWALTDDDFDFDTKVPSGTGNGASFSTSDTHGCSCEQVIAGLGLGKGHSKFGCSKGVLETWSRKNGP